MPEPTIPEYLSYATQNHASDIFIIAGRPLSVKIDGKLSGHGERLMPDDTAALIREIYHMAGERNFDRFLETGDDDFSFSIPGLSRFRVNTYRQRGSLAAVIRVIAFELPDPDVLNIPEDVMCAADFSKGMVLVTGSCRKRKIHHSGMYHRPYQSFQGRPYHHPGGSSGISAQT